ncbi:hypothetical protein F5B21DRAFT_295084 [Xylaria acuta]|nr:hypothetical protein F5B21DRAFT_295084 [Xylaria acuta]
MFNLVGRSRSLMEGKGVGRRAAAKAPVTHVPDEPLHGGPETVSDKTIHTRPSYNDYETPVNASKNAGQYASRPLPATPTSKAKMADRPSTSGGPGSSKTAKNDFKFDKRVSRDDFYLGSRAYGGTRSGPSASFRDQPPTPDTSPRTAPVKRFRSATTTTTTTWEPTSNSTKEVRNGNIGMALGSPSHPPNFTDTWNSQNATRPSKDSPPNASPPASRSSSVDTFDMPVSRKPTGKWKLFGLFGRKQSNQSIPAVSISDPNGLYGTNRPEEVAAASQASLSSGPKSPSRSNTTSSRKAPKHKPIVVRSQTMPLGVKADAYEKPRGREKRGDANFGRIPIALDTGVGSGPTAKPLLDVDIPDVRLERYSVMFNSVLNSNPSLLSRRQANVQKLKSVEDVVERVVEQKQRGVARRGTSPQPATRPSGLALFPTSRQGQHLMPQKLSPRMRSNTSPALLPSPSRATFHRKTPSPQRPSVVETSGLKHSRRPSPHHHHHDHYEKPGIAVTTDSHTTERESLSPSPRQFSNDQSNLILNSPTDTQLEDNDAAIPWQAWKSTSHQPPPEPKWQMISPSQKTPSTASSYASSHRKRSPSLASSSRTHITQPSDDLDDVVVVSQSQSQQQHPDSKMMKMKMTPVEISIARQISLSRQQRNMLLQPLRTGGNHPPIIPPPPPPHLRPSVSVSPDSGRKQSSTSSHAPSPASSSSSPSSRTLPPGGVVVVPVGEPGRIAETKTSTPTLVHPPDLLDPHNNVALLAQHRRSERIVLEDA